MKLKTEYLEHFKVGDMLSFSGRGLVSEVIKLRTQSHISHVAGVYGNYTITPNQPPQVLVIESTSVCDLKDDIHGEVIKGVQCHFLDKRVAMFEGEIYWHRLTNPLREDQWERMIQWVNKKHKTKTPYDTGQAIMSAIDWVDVLDLASEKDFSELFCSEMVAAWYQAGGLMSESCNPSEMHPGNLQSLPFLEPPILITEEE